MNDERNGPSILIGLGLIVFLLGLYFLFSGNAGTSAVLTSASVAKPNIVFTGKGLERIEVWAVPTGTGIGDNDHQQIGAAQLRETASDGTQTWTFLIPPTPILVTEIYGKGFAGGDSVGKISLPQMGATAIAAALWDLPGSTTSGTTTATSTGTITGTSTASSTR